MNYDKDRFINNVYVLAKSQKLKLGELESASGVSVGYFARLRQAGKEAAPAANLLMAFAARLSVSVDALLSFDFTQATGAERKLLNYMAKLRVETETRNLAWQRDPVLLNPVGSPAHPLYVNTGDFLTAEERDEMDLPDTVSLSQSVYRSVFRPDLDDLVPAAIFRCYFPGSRTLYLSAVAPRSRAVSGSAQRLDLELVMADPRYPDPIPLARTDCDNPGCLDKALVSLFVAVKKAVDLPGLRPAAEALIDDYLK